MYFVVLLLIGSALGNINVWPLPQHYTTGYSVAYVDPTRVQFICNSSNPLIENALQRYKNYIFYGGTQPNHNATLNTVRVFPGEEVPLALGVDESYSIDINENEAVLTSNTVWGSLRAIESFSQLVLWDEVSKYFVQSLPIKITDFPRFSWRGLLIDTSRHYLSVNFILHIIDSLSFNKFNVLHWHITDNQSFPYVSKKFPNLSKGAYRPNAVYTAEDIKKIVEYGHARGVRIIPEFDTPGHVWSWQVGHPELFPDCSYDRSVLDVTTSYTRNFIGELLQEISELFPDKYMHMGGDEVRHECWQSDPKIWQYMTQNNITGYSALQVDYEKFIEKKVSQLNKFPVFWEEVYDHSSSIVENRKIGDESIVQVWYSDYRKVAEIVKTGNKILFSAPWYLDMQIPLPSKVRHDRWLDTWEDFYNTDPLGNAVLSDVEKARILGGEACMWGEQVDELVFDPRVWPRACAVAERLWSDPYVRDIEAARARLAVQRANLIVRGVSATPVGPGYVETTVNHVNNTVPKPIVIQHMSPTIISLSYFGITMGAVVWTVGGVATIVILFVVWRKRRSAQKTPHFIPL